MSIYGAGDSITELLRDQYRKRESGTTGEMPEFRVFTASDIAENPEGTTPVVGVFFYQVDVDQARRYIELPSNEFDGEIDRKLALNLRCLLTVWGRHAARQQEVLQSCIEILDEFAIIGGHHLCPRGAWPEGVTLKVTMESMATEKMMRIWDSIDASYRLSIPYLVRTIRANTRSKSDGGPPVRTRGSE